MRIKSASGEQSGRTDERHVLRWLHLADSRSIQSVDWLNAIGRVQELMVMDLIITGAPVIHL